MSKTKKITSVLEKEEEYRRINELLEAKTAALVTEADNLLKKNEKQIDTPLLDNAIVNDEDFIEEENTVKKKIDLSNSEVFQNDLHMKITEIAGNINNSDPVPVQRSIANNNNDDMGNDGMEYEIQNRYLKAKLRVLQEDNEKLAKELLRKQEDISSYQGRIKDIEDERNRLQKINTTQMTQIEKSRKLSEDYKSKNEILEGQITCLKKEIEQSKKVIEQQNSANKGHEVRLNRAVEEASKFKNQYNQLKTTQKDTSDSDKKKIEQILSENRRLERQKAELIQAFRKQMQLIDVLKRQKMQIEVAKMLQFTEEEFVKALDWEK